MSSEKETAVKAASGSGGSCVDRMVKSLWLEKEKVEMDARLSSLRGKFVVAEDEDKKRNLVIDVAAKKGKSDLMLGGNDVSRFEVRFEKKCNKSVVKVEDLEAEKAKLMMELKMLGAKRAELEARVESLEARLAVAVAEMGAPITHFGNVANYAHTGGGTQAKALASSYRHRIDWVIDSGASKHVTGRSSLFKTYTPYTHSDSVQTADGTSQQIHGVGSVECTPSISLSSVLHVPSFPVNLLSVSSIIDQLKCIVIFDENVCVFQEKGTGRKIGTGIRRNGLWYVNHEELAMAANARDVEREIMLHHCRLGHPSFDNLRVMVPLSWSIRMKTALGAAKGLAFLHEAEKPVIYRDFKTSNILLDEEYNAKLSDFGLAKDGPVGDKSHVSTRIMGTYGYAAPEYIMTGHLTAMSDVYSYGVVLLELLTGRKSLDKSRPVREQTLADWAFPLLTQKKKVLGIVDPRLAEDYPVKAVQRTAMLAYHCLNRNPKARPLMRDIVATLEPLQQLEENPSDSLAGDT